MKIHDEKYIVLKGSTTVVHNRASALPAIISMRENLVESGVLELNNEGTLYVFTDNYIFNSPSYAASAIARWERKWKKIMEISRQKLKANRG